MAVILLFGGYLVIDGNIEVGVLVLFAGYMQNFFDPIQQLSQLYTTYQSGMAALDKIFDLLAEEPDVTDMPGAEQLGPVRGAIEFEDVWFSYAEERRCLDALGAEDRSGDHPGRDRRAGRRHRRGQIDLRQTRPALLRPAEGPRAGRRPRPDAASTRARCAGSSATCRRRATSSPARSPTTSSSASRARRARRSRTLRRVRRRLRPDRRHCRTDSTPSSASAEVTSRPASASWSRSRAR